MKTFVLLLMLSQAPDAPLEDAQEQPDTLCLLRADAAAVFQYTERLEAENAAFRDSIAEAKGEILKWMLVGTGIGAAASALVFSLVFGILGAKRAQ